MRVCALIPAYNEESRIGAVVEGARGRVDKVVVVDDGSTDGTQRVAELAGAQCIRLARNSGKGAAVRAGLEATAGESFTHVLTLDGDGQHRPEDIGGLVETARKTGVDMVIGARPFDRRRMPPARFFSNTFGSKAASLLVGRLIADSQSGFRLIRLDRLRSLRLRAKRYELEMEVLIKLVQAGGTIAHAPIQMIYVEGQATSRMKVVPDTIRICLWSLAFRFLGV